MAEVAGWDGRSWVGLLEVDLGARAAAVAAAASAITKKVVIVEG